MKYIKGLFGILMVLSLCVFTSCEQDNEGAIHNADNQGLSFTFNAFEMSAPANNPVISVPVYRALAGEAFSSNITVSATDGDGNAVTSISAPSSVSFAAGENKAAIDINLGEELGVGEVIDITIALNEADASVGGVSETVVSAYKEYVFESLGMGTFQDNWTFAGFTYNVEIQKADGFNRYRVIDPYKEGLTNDDGAWEDWIAMGTRCPYIEFWEVTDGLILFNNFALGINYEAAASQPIRAYHALEFSGTNPAFSKKIDAKTYQLAPYYYVNSLGGGWNNTEYDGIIVITLP